MTDPLFILRQHHISKKPILEKNDTIVFGDHSFPKSTKTNFLIHGFGKKGTPKEYYSLESVYFFLKNARLAHPTYIQNAAAANIPTVKPPDKKDLLLYLSGISASSPSIDKKALKSPKKFDKKKKSNQAENQGNTSHAENQDKAAELLLNEKISPEDVEETKENLKKMSAFSVPVADLMLKMSKRVKKEKTSFKKGLSFLDLKIMVYSNYVTNLAYYVYKKANGEKIENDPLIDRLVELRVVMEKMRPIEEKLKYQMNKLLSAVSSENIDTNDPLKFRANPDNLETQEEKDVGGSEEKESKAYVPPKISAAYFEEDNMEEKRAFEKARKKALSSSMMQELRREYDTGPEEIKEMHDPYKMKLSEEFKERERFEEEYMTRLPITKKQRHEMRQLTTVTNFSVKFDDISALDMNPGGKFKYKGKKKGSKRKR